MTSSYSVYLYFNGYVYAPEEATAKAGACLFWCIESEPPWEREALGKTGLMFSKSISEWNVYRTVETRGTLYQEGSFLREAWREQVIIRIHRKRFPVKAEQNFTFLRDPQLWSACTSFFYYLQCLDVSDVVLVVMWWSGWFMCLLWTVFSAPTKIHGRVPTDLILYIWALPFQQKVMSKSIMFQLKFLKFLTQR